MSFSTRSPVFSLHGCVACGQPLAAEAGLRILQRGGNAADAAVAVAACMNVTQPCSTGVGGDCFCLYYDAANKKVHGVNGRCVQADYRGGATIIVSLTVGVPLHSWTYQ